MKIVSYSPTSIGEDKAKRMNIKVHQLSEVQKESILEAVAACLKGFREISFAYAHGSFIGHAPFRDLDIALYVHPRDLPHARFRFEDRVSQCLEMTLQSNFPLDVRVMNQAPSAFQYHVIRGRLLMEQSAAYRIEVVCRIIQRYLDIKPILDHHTREAFIDATES